MTIVRDFTLGRGSTPRLRRRLTSRNVATGEVTRRPMPGDTIEWRIGWVNGERIASTAPGAAHALTVDPRSSVIEYPATIEDLAQVPGNGAPYSITIINAAGQRVRFAEGLVKVEGQV